MGEASVVALRENGGTRQLVPHGIEAEFSVGSRVLYANCGNCAKSVN